MKERILSNWHIQRLLYLAIGLFFTGYGIVGKDWTAFLPGLYFSSMAIFHFGCATGGCFVPASSLRKKGVTEKETVFEEIKST
jgi:hypothetical protein